MHFTYSVEFSPKFENVSICHEYLALHLEKTRIHKTFLLSCYLLMERAELESTYSLILSLTPANNLIHFSCVF